MKIHLRLAGALGFLTTLICVPHFLFSQNDDDRRLQWFEYESDGSMSVRENLLEEFVSVRKVAPNRDVVGRARSQVSQVENSRIPEVLRLKKHRAEKVRSGTTQAAWINEVPDERKLYIRFMINAVAGVTPEEGTILNFGGAILGYRYVGNSENNCELVYLEEDSEGESIWKSSGVMFGIEPHSGLSVSTKLAVKLNRGEGTWSLFDREIKMVENVPLVSTGGPEDGSVLYIESPVGRAAASIKEIAVAGQPYYLAGWQVPNPGVFD